MTSNKVINDVAGGSTSKHSEEIVEVINATPPWILRSGITVFFIVLSFLMLLSAFIKYPDIVKTQLTISSADMPKRVTAKIDGKIVKLLIKNDQFVRKGEPMAFIESTASHEKVLQFLKILTSIKRKLNSDSTKSNIYFDQSDISNLGELQNSFELFFQSYLSYKTVIENGLLLKKKSYLLKDKVTLAKQQIELLSTKEIQKQDLSLAQAEYNMHKKLAEQNVETSAELRQQESKLLSKKTPIIQTNNLLIASNKDIADKEKEITELDNQVLDEKMKFSQSVNSMISKIEDWKLKYVMIAPQSGKVSFDGIIQENQVINLNQDIFFVSSGNKSYFGEMPIPQSNLGKIKIGQKVLIKLRSYPYEEFGLLRGKIIYVSDVPQGDSAFLSKVELVSTEQTDMKKPIHLKPGLVADAEIITEDATMLQRLDRNITKIISSNR